MESIRITTQWGKEYNIIFKKDRYANNKRLCVSCWCEDEEYGGWEPYCNVTVNLSDKMPEGNYGFIDSNNADPVIIGLMYSKGWIEETERVGFSGYCVYPLVKFTDEFMEMI